MRNVLFALALSPAAGCGDDTVGHDLGISVDAGADRAVADLAKPSPDQSMRDLSAPEDLSMPDLFTPDLIDCTDCNGSCTYLDKDPMNCGACGHVCGCGSLSCTNGRCDPAILADKQGGPFSFALDKGLLYWSTDADATIWSVPTGGGPTTSIVNNATQVRGLAFDDTHIYLSRFVFNTMMVAPKQGGNQVNFSNKQEPGAYGVVTDGTTLFWLDYGNGNVRAAPLNSGASVTTLETNQGHVAQVAVDGSYVYWTESDNGTGGVYRAPKGGGNVESIATQQASPFGIAVDANYVYWNNQSDGTINRAPLSGGPIDVLADQRMTPYTIAIDADSIYWPDFAAGTVEKTALVPNGKIVTTLASMQDHPINLVVDASCVYFTNYSTGAAGTGSVRSIDK